MTVLRKSFYLVACAIVCGACGVDRGVEPGPREHEAAAELMLLPDSVAMEETGEFQLAIYIRNQLGVPASYPAISYSTSSALIATVSPGGKVTGIAPGTAVISAKATVGNSTYTDSTIITVRKLNPADSLVLEATAAGWAPTPAHLRAGGKVEWRPGVITAAGAPVTSLYLLTADPTVYETIDLTRGPVTRIFSSPGVFHYCSNNCWDPPEFGTIHVH